MKILKLHNEIKNDFELITHKIYQEKESITNLGTIPTLDKLIEFLIIGEDHRFYRHNGYDIIAICRAIRNKLIYNKTEGASTIEQQLVRVLTNQYKRSIWRKFKEIILASKLNKLLSKKEIALLYLSLAYFGTSKQGLKEIFDFEGLTFQSKLSDKVCARIIARLKYPEPKQVSYRKSKLIKNRTQHILNLKYENDKYHKLPENITTERIAYRTNNRA